jgi:hypothetical protein
MNPDDLDAILLSDKQIKPSSSFMEDVMERVQIEAAEARPIPFPWIRFAAVLLVLSIPILWFFPAEAVLRTMNSLSYSLGNWIISSSFETTLQNSFLTAFASLLGSLMLIWLSLRLAGARR